MASLYLMHWLIQNQWWLSIDRQSIDYHHFDISFEITREAKMHKLIWKRDKPKHLYKVIMAFWPSLITRYVPADLGIGHA